MGILLDCPGIVLRFSGRDAERLAGPCEDGEAWAGAVAASVTVRPT